MTAYICDRCGEYFQSNIKGLPLYVTKNPSNYHTLDLCPKCQKALEEWWTEKKKKEEEDEHTGQRNEDA